MADNTDVSTTDIFAMLAGEILPAHIHARRRAVERQQKIVDAQHNHEAALEKIHTQRLLNMRTRSMRFEDEFEVLMDDQGNDVFKKRYSYDIHITEEQYVDSVAKEAALRAVLNRRPHIPNKKETQSARRAAATAHHGPKKKGGNTKSIREREAHERELVAKRRSRKYEREWKRDQRAWRI